MVGTVENQAFNFIVINILQSNTRTDEKNYFPLEMAYLINEKWMILEYYLFIISSSAQFSSVQSLSSVRIFVTPWIPARQASLFITISQSSLRLTSIKSVMPSNHLILGRPRLLLAPIPPSSRVFPVSQLFARGGQSTGTSALASFLPKKSQGWYPSEWTGWISLQSKGLSRVFSNTMVQTHQFFSAQLSSQSNSHIHTWPQEKPQPWLDGP